MSKKGSILLVFFIVKLIVTVFIVINIYSSKISKIDDVKALDSDNTINDSYDLSNNPKILVNKYKNMANNVLDATNIYRSNVNKNNLVLDDKLSEIATIRAIEMAVNNKFSHQRPDGSYYSKLFDEYNIISRTSGENIASGFNDGYDVCNGWKNSKGHYANMINSTYNKLGVGIYKYNNTVYWVQIFTN